MTMSNTSLTVADRKNKIKKAILNSEVKVIINAVNAENRLHLRSAYIS